MTSTAAKVPPCPDGEESRIITLIASSNSPPPSSCWRQLLPPIPPHYSGQTAGEEFCSASHLIMLTVSSTHSSSGDLFNDYEMSQLICSRVKAMLTRWNNALLKLLTTVACVLTALIFGPLSLKKRTVYLWMDIGAI